MNAIDAPRRRIVFFDTTLRDGEQSPFVNLRADDKLRIAARLDRLGVDVIEAGFPATSKGERRAVRQIAEAGFNADICALARTDKADIDAVAAAGVTYVHTFMGTSPQHLQYKFGGMSKDEALRRSVDAVVHARQMGMRIIEFSAEDATRTVDRKFLIAVYQAVKEAGATRLNIPDTVGIALPEEMAGLTVDVIAATGLAVSVHCHNDLGHATANTIAAIRAGATCAQVTINGVGERAGNTALEEVAMMLRVRLDDEYEMGIRTDMLRSTSRHVSSSFGMVVQHNKAVVGRNAHAHKSGIHASGIKANLQTYSAYSPELVGAQIEIVAGKHSGAAGIGMELEVMGVNTTPEQNRRILGEVKRRGDKGKGTSPKKLMEIAQRVKREAA